MQIQFFNVCYKTLGKSKRANALVGTVEKATENFITKGEEIAYENPDIKQEMLSAVQEVRITGLCGYFNK